MTPDQAIITLIKLEAKKLFGSIKFDEPSHSYAVNGIPYRSVSSLIATLHDPFDKEHWSEYVAKKYNCPTWQVLHAWDFANAYSTNTGSYVHEELEKYACKTYLDRDIKTLTIDMRLVDLERANRLIEQGKKWLDDIIKQDYTLFATELLMCNHAKKLCGTADLIFYKEGKLHIADWKTNDKDLTKPPYGGKTMLPPVNMFPDNPYGHYSLQLNIYKRMLEQIAPVGELLIVHLQEEKVLTLNAIRL